jgi:hypothetical protein
VSLFLAEKGISTIDHQTYSPGLPPVDIWLFPNLKNNMLKRKHFLDVEDNESVKKMLTDNPVQDLKTVSKQ